MANLITTIRFALLFVLVASAYFAAAKWQLLNAPLLLLIIALDGVDGYVARRRGEASAFGAIFDIAVDRVVENVLWVVLAHLDLVPVWVAIVFITRGSIVDSIRYAAISGGKTAFGMMQSPLGRFLVAGRFMRGSYGAVKAVTFGWIFLVQPWPRLDPELWAAWSLPIETVTMTLVYASTAICVIRGVPVIAEFLMTSDVIRKPLRRRPKRAGYNFPV
ncbi:CDP-alcohol phosphatidyltransferase family protein [Rhodospirillaceae bacterium SYSU D60014]|uniref:CDP-alcohol phosphatidyltransferase family protein n=1 Tax=Virgifigura deserti TaxID=2268457 RepID=UPI000E66CC41